MNFEAKLEAAGLTLPPAPQAGGNYVPFKRAGALGFLAGVVSAHQGQVITGVLGSSRSLEEGQFAARCCALSHLATLQAALGSLERVEGIVSVTGFVCCLPGFADAPAVLNGYSDLMVEVFGEAGRHARAAVGVAALPREALVEVQLVVALKSG